MDKYHLLDKALKEAAEDAAHWPEVCDEIATIFGAVGVVFVPLKLNFRGPWLVCSESVKDAIADYTSNGWYLKDKREPLVPIILQRGYGSDDDFIERHKRIELPYYRDFLFKHGLGFYIAVNFSGPGMEWVVSIQFKANRHPIDEKDMKHIAYLRECMPKAIEQASQTAKARLFEMSELVVGQGGQVTFFNLAGDECFTLGSVETNSDRTFLKAELPTPVQKLVDDAVKSPPSSEFRNALQFELGNELFNIVVMQCPASLRHFHHPHKVMGIISKMSADPSQHTTLQRAFDLSNLEVETVRLLAEGLTLKDIAKLQDRALGTIRQRLKTIMSKTHTSTQAQLVSCYFNNKNRATLPIGSV